MTDWKEWCPDTAIEELTLKRALQDVEDPVKLANQLIKDALPGAIMRLIHTTMHEPNAQIASSAAKYLCDRSMGSVQSPTKPESEAPAWQKIFDSIAVVADPKRD